MIGKGSISLNGTIAYAAQSAWILNATIRDNIIFGKTFDPKRYEAIIQACQLTHDLSLLDDGDLTEIGENGINLSGGQRQRVSIARAAYSDADVIVLDDPLSALDPEVSNRLFEDCIKGLMKGKTRIFATNQLHFLQHCDNVLALGDGIITEQGSFQELSKNKGEVSKLLKDLNANEESSEIRNSSSFGKAKSNSGEGKPKTNDTSGEKGTKGKSKPNALISEEERNVGGVSFSVYKKYLQAGGGAFLFSFILLMYILAVANELLNTLWVSLWTSDANYERQSQGFYLGLYSLFSITAGIFVFFRALLLARFGVRASRALHKLLLDSILRAPMSFFDTTPTV